MKVGKTSLVEKMRVKDRRVIELSRPCPPSIPARDAWCARSANRVLRVVIVKPIDVRSEHKQSFTMQYVRAGLGNDVQRWASGPAEFGRKRVRKDRKFLDGADRHGRDRGLAAPPLIVVRAV